jgi:hypothetical protein
MTGMARDNSSEAGNTCVLLAEEIICCPFFQKRDLQWENLPNADNNQEEQRIQQYDCVVQPVSHKLLHKKTNGTYLSLFSPTVRGEIARWWSLATFAAAI